MKGFVGMASTQGDQLWGTLKNVGLLLGVMLSVSILIDRVGTPSILRQARAEAHRMDLELESRMTRRLDNIDKNIHTLLERK